MYKYLGLIIAVENYHNDVKPVKYATEDAKEFRNSLISLGCMEDRLELIVNEKATKTTIEEKIKEISKIATESDIIVLYYAGHGYYYNGENVLTCVDSSPRAIKETTVSLNYILNSFEKALTNKVIAFLDCCHSGIEFSDIERSQIGNFSIDELKYYDRAEHLTVFASCKSDQHSHTDLLRNHGAWSYYLLQALQGKAEASVYDDEFLFSDKLQKYLLENTYKRVKEITPEKKNQTPVKFGKETTEKFIVADLTRIFEERAAKIKTEGVKFEKATILVSEEDWVRNLPGFNKEKGHKPPKISDDWHEKWIKEIAKELIEDELNAIGAELRDKLKYKRKDIEPISIENGVGQLSTIDFDYVIIITQSKYKPDSFILTRLIENFKNSDILAKPEFNQIFESTFNEIEFTLVNKLNVADVIDKIEEVDDEKKIKVEYDHSNTTECNIFINELAGYIYLTSNTIKLVSHKKNSPEQLVLSFKDMHKAIEQHKIPKMLL